MSRLAKKPIVIPQKTEVTVTESAVTVKGPLGELSRPMRPEVGVVIKDGEIWVEQKSNSMLGKALIGTYASHIRNMVDGVNKSYEKKLILEGVGFKSDVQGNTLVLALGFSHPVKVEIPTGLSVKAEKNVITIEGINKEKVGQFAAQVRSLKKPEPYKGKGMRYEGEVIRRKEGKKTA
ncbi:MAG: 50S ribosomal protein L6 [Candidatus Zambryskibacteria bacterium CG10_big_fil_rev_8_21_14_0_10_42_12]|uniref:Large ribosomal subunit protein uL6 n=1 Tax=Candidatus Zambryskibacteria bacterium CG10_big_fil_rev_8_21_14_0_10_42_12 TaxID=1975115 RepID=A0A2H0QY67_9BACT|nr:MAG: 50S ribosomal protein L6 [Candidatus Zambryskibacteria bacterium CG10_big_fil_rev_8_21_14_0_10_42_12]